MDKNLKIQDVQQNVNLYSKKLNDGEDDELKFQSKIHMFQRDIAGFNSVDYAFEHRQIFCLKAFVESLLKLPNEPSFRNCFNKALLFMIEKGIDV